MFKRMIRLTLTTALLLLFQSPLAALPIPGQETPGPTLWERLAAPWIELWERLFEPASRDEEPASIFAPDCGESRGTSDPWGCPHA